MSSTTEAHPPTFHWATITGGIVGGIGLLGLGIAITVGIYRDVPPGVPAVVPGATALAAVLALGGLIMVLWRMLICREVSLVDRLEAMDRKLDNVWGIAATTSLEAQPFHPQTEKPAQQKHTQRRGRRRKQGGAETVGDNVVPMRARRAADALRRLTEQIKDEPNA